MNFRAQAVFAIASVIASLSPAIAAQTHTLDGSYSYGTGGYVMWTVTVSRGGTHWQRTSTANTRLPQTARATLDAGTLNVQTYVKDLGGPMMWYHDTLALANGALVATQSRCCLIDGSTVTDARLTTLKIPVLPYDHPLVLPWDEIIPELVNGHRVQSASMLTFDPLSLTTVRFESGPRNTIRYTLGTHITTIWYDAKTLMPDRISTGGSVDMWNCAVLPKHCE